MKTLKRIFVFALVVVALLMVVALFLPSRVHVERSITANVPPERVFAQINTLKNWEKWSPWYAKDPQTKLTYEGPAEGKGAKYSWDSASQGKGNLIITESAPNKKVRTDLDFMEHGKGVAELNLEKQGEGTRITWWMETDMGWNPIAKSFGLLMDRMLGPDFESGLASLKKAAEAAPAPTAPNAPAKPAESTPAK